MGWSWVGRACLVGVCAIALSACEEEGSGPPDIGENPVTAREAACLADGGRWGKGGKADLFVCYRITKDGGQRCESKNDCQGFCLARSQTCAPVTPMFGCNEVLGRSGARSTICVD